MLLLLVAWHVVDMHLVGELELVEEEMLVAEGHDKLVEALREAPELVRDGGQDGGLDEAGAVGQDVGPDEGAINVPDEDAVEAVRLLGDGLLPPAAPLPGHRNHLLVGGGLLLLSVGLGRGRRLIWPLDLVPLHLGLTFSLALALRAWRHFWCGPLDERRRLLAGRHSLELLVLVAILELMQVSLVALGGLAGHRQEQGAGLLHAGRIVAEELARGGGGGAGGAVGRVAGGRHRRGRVHDHRGRGHGWLAGWLDAAANGSFGGRGI